MRPFAVAWVPPISPVGAAWNRLTAADPSPVSCGQHSPAAKQIPVWAPVAGANPDPGCRARNRSRRLPRVPAKRVDKLQLASGAEACRNKLKLALRQSLLRWGKEIARIML